MTEKKNPTVRVLALVGTDHHPFDRMVKTVDEMKIRFANSGEDIHYLVQFGTAQPPEHAQGVDYLTKDAVQQEINRADLILSHGGPSTIVEILRSGQLPLVLPRDPQRGEHVDGHQQRFAQHMANQKLIELIDSVQQLEDALRKILRGETRKSDLVRSLPSPDDSARKLGQIVANLVSSKQRVRR